MIKFYADLAEWLFQWLNENVGDEENNIPDDIDLEVVKKIIIVVCFRYISRHPKWAAPVQKTAIIFNKQRSTVSRAIKNISRFM